MPKVHSMESLVDKVKFATIEKANELLSQEDGFTRSWSQFDIDSRMQKAGSTKEALFDLIAEQTRAWTEVEKKNIVTALRIIDQEIESKGYNIDFPEEIYFVKTTANEEGGAAGYTRSNYVVLKEDYIAKAGDQLKNIVVHELFHILTRSNPEFRKEMYAIIGFKMMNEVAYPDHIKDYRITNPDAPQVDSYISVKVNDEPKDCMMILYANKNYNGGAFFKYLKVGFLSLVGDTVKTVEYNAGKPVIYTMDDISDFYEQVGRNTGYTIHPEEILADNFTFTILNKQGLPNPQIRNEIKKILLK